MTDINAFANSVVEICQVEGISTVKLMDSIREQGVGAKLLNDFEDKKRYLLHLIRMMMSDGKYLAIELHVIQVLAGKIGVSPMQLLSWMKSMSGISARMRA